MSKPPLLVAVQPHDLQPRTMADAIRDIMEECIAAQPVTVFLAWNLPGHEVPVLRSVPDCKLLRKGYMDRMYEVTHPAAE